MLHCLLFVKSQKSTIKFYIDLREMSICISIAGKTNLNYLLKCNVKTILALLVILS
jgi:hypothetical protein